VDNNAPAVPALLVALLILAIGTSVLLRSRSDRMYTSFAAFSSVRNRTLPTGSLPLPFRDAVKRLDTRGTGNVSELVDSEVISRLFNTIRNPAGHLRDFTNLFVIDALQASQGLGRDRIPLGSAGSRSLRYLGNVGHEREDTAIA
jgi:hypothetical protein